MKVEVILPEADDVEAIPPDVAAFLDLYDATGERIESFQQLKAEGGTRRDWAEVAEILEVCAPARARALAIERRLLDEVEDRMISSARTNPRAAADRKSVLAAKRPEVWGNKLKVDHTHRAVLDAKDDQAVLDLRSRLGGFAGRAVAAISPKLLEEGGAE